MNQLNLTTTEKNITSEVSAFIQRRAHDISNPIRKSAFEFFQQAGLPAPKHEEYKYTPITRELEKNFSFQQLGTESSLKDVTDYLIPDLDANILVFLNGVYSPTLSVIISPSSQLQIENLEE
ncbi:MAG TPA: hypothetical protein VIQ51_07290, partial [Chryseosolibacter sp.]